MNKWHNIIACLISLFNVLMIGSEVPVIFIHRGNSFYLKDSLWQAKQFNRRVILIGDKTNNHYPYVEHYNMDDYFTQAHEFEKFYKHISPNAYKYELFCIQRWFILNKFLKEHMIEACCHCDSDIMLYCNVTDEYKKCGYPEISSLGMNLCFSFHTLKRLDLFCNFIMEGCKNGTHYEHVHQVKENFNDMVLCVFYKEWCKKQNFIIPDLEKIYENSVFDGNMALIQGGFQMKTHSPTHIKNIQWKGKVPYCLYNPTNTLIRMKCLHFWGPLKGLMASYRIDKH